MAVCVLAMDGKAGRERAYAGLDMGSAVRLIMLGPAGSPEPAIDMVAIDPEDVDAVARIAAAVPDDADVLLAGGEVPAGCVRAFFATETGQRARKILDCGVAPEAADTLACDTDMLIFDAAGFSALLDLDALPADEEGVLPVRPLLTRPNQAAVVRLDTRRAAAVWADRTMLVGSGRGAAERAATLPRFCGTIAAAVDQKIGPEPALNFALAAAYREPVPA